MIEWMNEWILSARETRGTSRGVYSLAVDGNSSVRQWQFGKDVGTYCTSRGVRTWRILAQVITCDFYCFSQRALHGVHSSCSHRSVVWSNTHKIRNKFDFFSHTHKYSATPAKTQISCLSQPQCRRCAQAETVLRAHVAQSYVFLAN